MKKAAADNEKIFGNFTSSPLQIKFDYDENVFKKRNLGLKDYSGLYSIKDKTIYIYIKDCYTNLLFPNDQIDNTESILMHEYTHHIFYEFLNKNQISKDKIPIWFIEGVSQYTAYQGNQGIPPKTLVSFNELNTKKQWEKYCNESYNVYEQSHYAVNQLIMLKDKNVIRNILLKTKDTDFNTAFKDVVGLSIGDYEKSFKEDFKNNWEKYKETIKPQNSDNYTDIRIQCIEKYTEINPGNINALLDLASFYENNGELNKAKSKIILATKQKTDNYLPWLRMTLLYEELNDFDNAIKANEKAVSISDSYNRENPAGPYLNLSQLMLLKDINKSVEIAEKAKEKDKSNYVNLQVQALINLKNSIKNGKPYEGCLQLIKAGTINSSNVKKALIEKMLKNYLLTRNSSRSQLEKIKNEIK
ncbi:MAG: tetratricopeptide repeat family protein [Clostridiaceae bacterium]|nr:tetratricopeptide repeat family protein [Clostridiaceae bacterium]